MRVLVVGAGGRFAPLADLLLERGHAVLATSRDVGSPPARRLASLGAEIVHADFEDVESLRTAFNGVDAVFAGGTAHHFGPEGERRHGLNLASAAATVPHLVYVSGDGAAADSALPLFRAKWEVEAAIMATGAPNTILAPTYLMENLFNRWNLPALQAGVLPSPVAVDRPLQQTALADLISLAALTIEQPERFAGERIPLASDELTAVDAAQIVSGKIPRELEARQVPGDQLPASVRFLFDWLASTGHSVDTESLRRALPEIGWHDYSRWAETQLDRFHEICPHPEPVA